MECTHFIGIDVSKNELDFAVMRGRELLFHRETANTPQAVRAFLKELAGLPGFALGRALFCLEHTGIYNNHLLALLHPKGASVCLESATQIRNSMGNVRGKNDKVDSIRIAEYAHRHRDALRTWKPKREAVQRLAHLSGTRSRLPDAQRLLKGPIRENSAFVEKGIARQGAQLCSGAVAALTADLARTEKAISELIASDAELARLFGLVTSVEGVGPVTAAQLLVSTNEFRDITEPKKFACYAGVVPFTKESGVYKGRAKVSKMANMKVKTLLHMSALSAIGCNGDMKEYYRRKVEQDKKNKMSVINAVRNKIVLRIFACVNQNRKYDKTYRNALA